MVEWDQARIEQLIKDETQESLTLDYKAREALAKDNRKRDEITKDVAAMANSDGGVLIYGVKEFDDPNKRHLPEKIEPVDLTEISKEWLETIILNIRPRIDGITITPVVIDFAAPNGVVYVVEIPQSTTAHQSNDHRYYKRFNFMSVPMEDYEVRDVMGRGKDPKIELKFRIEIRKYKIDENSLGFMGMRRTDNFGFALPPKFTIHTAYFLETEAINVGVVFAQYVNADITLPCDLLYPRSMASGDEVPHQELNLEKECSYYEDNTVRDAIKANEFGVTERAAARYIPILPSTVQSWANQQLTDHFEEIDWGDSAIKWIVYCDNAQPLKGEIRIKDIPVYVHDKTNNR